MATISISLALNKSPFFFFRDNSVKRSPENYVVDTSDIESITSIIRGINDERITSSMSVEALKQYLPGGGGSGGSGGGGGTGTQGPPGESAYQIARRLGQANGVSESEWIQSLRGPQGQQGQQGNRGPKGDDFNFTSDPLASYNEEKARR